MLLGGVPSQPASAQSSAVPVLTYSSFLGGGNPDNYVESAYGVAVGPGGFVYLVGSTSSAFDFPFTRRLGPDSDRGAFVMKFDPATKAVVYLTLVPGCTGRSIAVDASGSAYITGECGYGLPLVNAAQPDYGGGDDDAFVAKLSADGSQLLYCTFLGGSGADLGRRIRLDADGQVVVVAGTTDSTNFPGTAGGVAQPASGGRFDAFIARLDASAGSVLNATYLGGNGNDMATGLALDGLGNVYVAGRADLADFASAPNPIRFGTNLLSKAFVAKLAGNLASVQYLAFLGGDGTDEAAALALDAARNAYVFGATTSTNFPVTAGAAQPRNAGDYDDFVVKLDSSGGNMVYGTYLGGSSSETLREPLYVNNGYQYFPLGDIQVDDQGNVYVAGQTDSTDAAPPAVSANRYTGGADGYLAKLNAAGSALVYFRYLGDARSTQATALGLETNGDLFVTGNTGLNPSAPYFPVTPGAFQSRYGGSSFDAFFMELSEAAPAPANDHFASRTPLAGSRLTVQVNNTGASLDPGEPAHAGLPGGASLWWTWTAPANGQLAITTAGSSIDTLLAAYTGDALGSLVPVAGNDDESADVSTSAIRFAVAAGTTCQIAVDGKNGAVGSVYLSLTFSAPGNDDFANRITLTGFPVSASGSNVDATLERGETPEFYYSDRTVWWSWTSPLEGNVAITTAGSSFNTALSVYTNATLATLGLAEPANDNETNGLTTSRVTLQAHLGTTYQIAVSGINDASGTIALSVLPSVPPTNDNWAAATVLGGTLAHDTNFNASATTEPGEPGLGLAAPGGRTLWWRWTAPADGLLQVNTEGSDFDTRLGLLAGANLAGLTLIAANDDERIPGDSYYLSRLQSVVTSNTTYYLVVDGSQQNPVGRIALNLFFSQPPTILPDSAGLSPGLPFHFQVRGLAGQAYRVETSTNLAVWTPLPSGNLTGPLFDFADTNNPAGSHRFYRVSEAH